jgi:hydrogenase nickel incorporation protein HypA/HybF
MHEISIAISIVEIAEANARKQGAVQIQLVKIRLGEFTTIVREALEFAFEIARQDTLAAHAELEIEIVPMIVQCSSCGVIPNPVRDIILSCPRCGLPLEIVAGEDIQLEYIEVESRTENLAWNV